MNSDDLRPFLRGVFRAKSRLATAKNDEGLEVFGRRAGIGAENSNQKRFNFREST